MSQKLIILLGAAQTILLLTLLIKVIGLERSIEVEAKAEQPTVTEETTANDDVAGQPVISTQSLSEKRLRQIVREEVGSQLKEFSASLTQPANVEEFEPISAAEYQYRLEATMQHLDYYIGEKEISDIDMANLQGEIARLDDEGRRQMLSPLTQALNSGELEGRF